MTCLFLFLRNCEVGGKGVQTQRCKLASTTLCVFVTYIRSRRGRSSIAPFPMQNIVAKTTQQRTIARDDVSLKMILTAVSFSFFIVSTIGDEVACGNEHAGTCGRDDIAFMLTLTTVPCSFFSISCQHRRWEHRW